MGIRELHTYEVRCDRCQYLSVFQSTSTYPNPPKGWDCKLEPCCDGPYCSGKERRIYCPTCTKQLKKKGV